MDDKKPRADASWYTPYLRALEITRVQESQRIWYVRWVERFADFLKEKPLTAAVREDVESFTSTLRSAPDIEDWKIRNAYLSLRLLLTAVYGKRWDAVGDVSSGNTVDGDLDPFRAVCRALLFTQDRGVVCAVGATFPCISKNSGIRQVRHRRRQSLSRTACRR